MIILPDRNIPRSKFLMPVFDKEWRVPSQSIPYDQMDNLTQQTRFRINAKSNDGVVIWSGWFEDRSDFDAFLWAIAKGTLKQERALWDLPTPSWQPYLGELISYEFATVSFLTGSPGSNQTFNRPTDWNNFNNNVQTLGGGGSGGANGENYMCSGAGGGAWNKQINIILDASATYRIGSGGTAVSTPAYAGVNGNAGGDTWFNGSTLAASSVGSKGGGAGIYTIGNTTPISGGSGGIGSSGVGSSSFSGGTGGTTAGSAYASGTGAGGAAGPNGNGGNGVNASTGQGTNGGSGDAGFGGSAGSGAVNSNSGSGGNGAEWGASYGSGGGGGGVWSQNGVAKTAGSGGNYGGGGGACYNLHASATSGAGIQGIIVLTYEPTPFKKINIPMLGL